MAIFFSDPGKDAGSRMDNNSLNNTSNTNEQEPGRRSRKRKHVGSLAIILGLILIVAAAILVAHNLQEAAEAGSSALENSGILNDMINENMIEAE